MQKTLNNVGTIALGAIMINSAYHNPVLLYKNVVPSVVSIESYGSRVDPFDIHNRSKQRRSLGAGFITNHARIITNFHVIEDSEEIHVKSKLIKDTIATLVYADPLKDIAVLSISSETGLKSAPLCTIDPHIGEDIYAIGSPFGLEFSMSEGIISGLDREINGVMLIQTDASINPGNSGGPLFSLDGCVTGMATSIISESGSSAGVGFGIPAVTLKNALEQIDNEREVMIRFE